MRTKILMLVLLMFSAATPLADNSSAQTATAAVNLECVPPDAESIDIEVHPGASLTGYTICTVSNPTIHVEKISITVQGDGLVVAAPGSITVAAGSEEEFQVSVRADSRMTTQARTLYVEVYVQEISGVPPPNNANSDSTNIINIVQFAEFNVEMEYPIIELELGSNHQLIYALHNTGNGYDSFNILLDYDEKAGASFSLPITKVQAGSWSFPEFFRISVNSPNDGSDWILDSSGRHTLQMVIEVTVESDFGCQQGDCLTTTMNQRIIFFQNQTVEETSGSSLQSNTIDSQVLIYGGMGTVVFLVFGAFVIMRKRK